LGERIAGEILERMAFQAEKIAVFEMEASLIKCRPVIPAPLDDKAQSF
jgi:hypothetical protein